MKKLLAILLSLFLLLPTLTVTGLTNELRVFELPCLDTHGGQAQTFELELSADVLEGISFVAL